MSTSSIFVTRQIFLFFFYISSLREAKESPCHNELIFDKKGCECNLIKPWKMIISCKKSSNFNKLKFLKSSITDLEIRNIEIDSTNRDIFINTKLKKLKLDNVRFHVLKDKHNIFAGVEDTLKYFEIYNNSRVSLWIWPSYFKFNHVTHIVIENIQSWSSMGYVFNAMPNLEYIEIRNSSLINWLTFCYGLSKLGHVRLLCLSANGLNEMKRQYMPKPAEELWHLDLSYNMLTTLSMDLFTEMPKLTEVKLDHNKLAKISEKVMLPVLHQLKELWIHDNPFVCSEDLCWIFNYSLPAFTVASKCSMMEDDGVLIFIPFDKSILCFPYNPY